MTAAASGVLTTLVRAAREELLPFEGRAGMAWRVAAQCMLASAVFMTYGIPLAAIGCYLVLFIMKPDSTESSLMAVGITVLVSLVVGLMFAILQWTINSPVAQMGVLVGASILFLYLGAASQIGPGGNILALVVAFIMTLVGEVPLGEVATRGMLYAWLMATAPMGVVVLFNLFLGRQSVELLRASLSERLIAAAEVLEGAKPPGDLDPLLREGNGELNKRVGLTKLLHLTSTAQSDYLKNAVAATYRLLLAVSNMPAGDHDPDRLPMAARCRAAADALARGRFMEGHDVPECDDPMLEEVRATLVSIKDGTPQTQEHAAPREGFFFHDALTNPAYQHFALRTTAAAVICYLTYTALGWQGIHTAMVTCYVAALGSTAETVHKLVLRIAGCLIGAAMGIGAILFVMPNITSIGALMVLVFCGILVAGWVAAGSERISYAGIQIGLAFLLTILQGFGPVVKMDAATDRIIGILLGNFVMYLMFTRLWPTGLVATVAPQLERALKRLSFIVEEARNGDPGANEVADVMSTLNTAREGLQMMIFEPRKLRPAEGDVAALQDAINKATHICHLVGFKLTRQTSEYRQAISEIPSLMQAVKRVST